MIPTTSPTERQQPTSRELPGLVSLPAELTGRAALVVAHPGHELRVHGWLESARPRVFVLTDGSGGGGEARLESTTRVLDRSGLARGAAYGVMSDKAVYAAMLERDVSPFLAIVDVLAESFVAADVAYVVADAVEHYNPSHDVCRFIVDAAVAIAARRRGRPIAAWAFPLVGNPRAAPPGLDDARTVELRLGGDAFERKLAAARGYPELAHELETALADVGPAAFTLEVLRRVPATPSWAPLRTPYYETYGERQVAAGRYTTVLRYADHVRPVAAAIAAHGARAGA